jgi:hypothetical protein
MSLDTRLSGILDVLLHMAEHRGPVTSEVLARSDRAVYGALDRGLAVVFGFDTESS